MFIHILRHDVGVKNHLSIGYDSNCKNKAVFKKTEASSDLLNRFERKMDDGM